MVNIKQVAIVGGTHGNELSGICLLEKWQQDSSLVLCDSFVVDLIFANPKSYEENKRYIDNDLNRQFSINDLNSNNLSSYEQTRAKVLNFQLGPKGSSKTDFIIDLHNTTSNMGPTLVLLQSDSFNCNMGAYIKEKMPEAVILFEDHKRLDEHYFLSSISPQGVIVEIGPQPQSVLRQDILDWMNEMTNHILDYIHLNNIGAISDLPKSYEAFRHEETLKFPENELGQRIAMIHKNLQDSDFKLLKKGDFIFTLFDGAEISWQGEYEAYPHFINEAAYYNDNLAMSLAKKFMVST